MDLSLKLSSNMDDIVKMITTRLASMEERLDKATSSPEPVHTDITSLSREFTDFKTFVWKTLALYRSQLEFLSLGHERHEIYQRKKVLLFHGVSDNKNEKIHDVIKNVIVNQVGLSEFSGDSIQSCFRLGNSSNKPRPVLVRFKDLEYRQLVWDSKTSLKGSGITISEFLTKTRHNLFMEARRHFGMHNCWSSDGKIVILLPDKSRRKVELNSELQSLINQFPQQKPQDSAHTSSSTKDSVKYIPSKDKFVAKSPKKTKRRQ